MKMKIDIPDEMLREAIQHTGAKTGGEAVAAAIEEFNRRCRLKELAERLHGSCPNFMSQSRRKRTRKDRK
jgi:hypothetical protein